VCSDATAYSDTLTTSNSQPGNATFFHDKNVVPERCNSIESLGRAPPLLTETQPSIQVKHGAQA